MEASQHTQLTVVKFKFKPGTGTPQDILKFPEWRQSLGNLRRIVNWRYATHGIGLNMDWDLVLFIGQLSWALFRNQADVFQDGLTTSPQLAIRQPNPWTQLLNKGPVRLPH